MTTREGTFALARRGASVAMIVGVGAIVVPALWTGEIPVRLWQAGMLATAVAAIAISLLADRGPLIYSVVAGGAVLQLVTVGHDQAATPPLAWIAIVGDVVLAVGIATLLIYSGIRRLGPPRRRDLVEAAVVMVGASVAAWVALVDPLMGAGDSVVRAVMVALYVPISVIVAAFAVDLWNNGLRSNRAFQFAAIAAIFHAAGALAGRVLVAYGPDAIPTVTPAVLHSLAGAFLFAALVHPQFPVHLERVDSPDRRARLAIMGLAVLVPVIVMAVNAPSGPGDTIVRAVSTLVLVALVVARLAGAVHENELAHESLSRRIYRDDLTDLPTRPRLVELVHEMLESNSRSDRCPALIHVNVDRFKNINDTFGHRDANQVLVEIADRIRDVAEQVGASAARLSGDDFAIIDPTTSCVDDALAHTERIRAALAEPIVFTAGSVFVTASIGVAVATDERTLGAEELIRCADIANHHAKLDGGNRVAVFDDSMRARVAHRMDVEHALHGAVGRHEMRLHHQPIVDITTGRVCGVEALIRWHRGDGSIVSPTAFIPIAEDTGMICEIGVWALRDALGTLRTWIDRGIVAPTTTVSVNVSPRQIADRGFAADVRAALEATGVPAHLLWLEMTESMMLDEPDLAQSMLREVRAMGVRLALDDFGTGFSSLSLLQKFPIQRIKIDRAFVHGIADNTNDRSLVRTIIAMAHSMGLDLVAEGVETVDQLRGLRELGCGKAQGYLISHPVSADAMASTMSALDELAALPLFAGGARSVPMSSADPMPPGPVHQDRGQREMANYP